VSYFAEKMADFAGIEIANQGYGEKKERYY